MVIDARWEANELVTRLGLIVANISNDSERIPLAELSIEDWLAMDHETLKRCFSEFVVLLMSNGIMQLSMSDVERIMENNRFNAIITDNFDKDGN